FRAVLGPAHRGLGGWNERDPVERARRIMRVGERVADRLGEAVRAEADARRVEHLILGEDGVDETAHAVGEEVAEVRREPAAVDGVDARPVARTYALRYELEHGRRLLVVGAGLVDVPIAVGGDHAVLQRVTAEADVVVYVHRALGHVERRGLTY